MPETIQIENFKGIDFKQFIFPMITIYKHPKDFPDKFVARIFDVREGKPAADPHAMIKDTIEEIHDVIPEGFMKMKRSPDDDPAIAEVWI